MQVFTYLHKNRRAGSCGSAENTKSVFCMDLRYKISVLFEGQEATTARE